MIIKILLYFIIYAFLGWCTEVIYSALKKGKFINRGFLNGPVCPIYGFGVVTVVFLLEPVKDNFFLMFLGSVIITSLMELVTGFILEKSFHHKWWDYSNESFNIGGYICPIFSLMWGFACLIIVAYIHPLIANFVNFIPEVAAKILLLLSTAIFIIDLIATVKTIFKLNKKLERIEELSAMIRKASDDLGENIASGTIAIVNKKEEIEDEIDEKKKVLETNIIAMKQAQREAMEHREQALLDLKKANKEIFDASIFGQMRLLKAFPGMKSTYHKEALEKLKNHILNRL